MRCVYSFLFLILLSELLPAAGSRADLLFEINTSLKTQNRIAFAECFNFQKTDVATQKSTAAMINRIFNWPNPRVFTSERNREGKMIVSKAGKSWTLNGQWTFNVHVFAGPPPSEGFVFPAGVVADRYRLLLMGEEKP